MEHISYKTRSPLVIAGAIFLVIGIGLFLGGAIAGKISYDFAQHADVIDGKITHIETYHKDDKKVTVEYVVDDQTYEQVLDSYSSSWYTGKTIELYCDRDNPYHVCSKSLAYLVTFILCGIGFVFIILGICFITKAIKIKKIKNWLLTNGERRYGEITSVTSNPNIRVNHRIPYYLICTTRDDYTGQQVNYKSKPIYVRPMLIYSQSYGQHFEKFIGQQVVIYVNPNKPKQYYVDLDIDKIMNEVIDM